MPTEQELLGAVVARVPLRGDIGAVRRKGAALRRRRRLVAGAVGAVVLLGALGIGALLADRVVGDARTEIVDAPPAGSWSPVPGFPLEARVGAVRVATGDELVVWGGTNAALTALDDGAVYHLDTATWRPMADPPAGVDGGEFYSAALWDREVIIVGGELQGVAHAVAYDIDADTWRALADPPFRTHGGMRAVWTGSTAIFIGGSDTYGAPDHVGYEYDRSADSWRPLPDPPHPDRVHPFATWTGSEIVLLGGYLPDTFGSAKYPQDGAAFSPDTGTWRVVSPDPRADPQQQFATPAGVVVFDTRRCDNTCAESTLYEPATDSWRTIEQGPAFDEFSMVVVVGDELVGWARGIGAALDPRRGTWRAIAPFPLDRAGRRADAVAAGERVFVMLDDPTATFSVWQYVHAPIDDQDLGPTTTGRRPDGTASDETIGMDAARLLSTFARGQDDGAIAAVQFADTVTFVVEATVVGTRTGEQLAERDRWSVLDPASDSPQATVSALDLLASTGAANSGVGPRTTSCADDPPPISNVERSLMVTIENIGAASCADWFAIDLYVRDGKVHLVRIDRTAG